MVNLIDICITQKKKIKIALAKGKCHFIKALVFPKDIEKPSIKPLAFSLVINLLKASTTSTKNNRERGPP